MVRRPEWTDVRLDDNHWTTLEVVGGHILKSKPRGYATGRGVATLNHLHREVIAAAITPGAPHVHIADYTDFEGASLDARRGFADDIKGRDGLAALIVHNAPPLFKLSIKLGKRFFGLRIPIEITANYFSAIHLALDILREAGVEGIPRASKTVLTAMGPQAESGAYELDSLGLKYEVIDGHIIHANPTGYLGLREMSRAIDFESLVLSSIDPCNQNPGCMAGNVTIYAAVLILPTTLILLIISTAIVFARGKMSGRRALITNSLFALAPFILVFAPFIYN